MRWTEQADEYLRANYGTDYAEFLAEHLETTADSVRRRAFRLGLTARRGCIVDMPISRGFRGVSRVGNRWQARFRGVNLGSYRTQEEAAVAYNVKAKAALGDKARLNDVGEGAGGQVS